MKKRCFIGNASWISAVVCLIFCLNLMGEENAEKENSEESLSPKDSVTEKKTSPAEKKEEKQLPPKDTLAEKEVKVAEKKAVEFESISGPLPKTVKAKDTPYLVVSDIEVPPDRIVTIEPGTVFLFKNFAGLHVQGRLIAEGTKVKPIVFTSEYDRSFNPSSKQYPNPYDWNGMYIHSDGLGTRLSFCKILYSVYGIVSETKFIRIDPCLFKNNGRSDLVIEGTEHKIQKGPYRYVLSKKDATIDGVPVNLLKDPLAPRRNIVRYTSLAAILGGCAATAFQALEYRDSQERLESLSDKDDFENLQKHTSEDWEVAQENRNFDILLGGAGLGVGLLGIIGFVWTFTF